jgi:hypothetical protein
MLMNAISYVVLRHMGGMLRQPSADSLPALGRHGVYIAVYKPAGSAAWPMLLCCDGAGGVWQDGVTRRVWGCVEQSPL